MNPGIEFRPGSDLCPSAQHNFQFFVFAEGKVGLALCSKCGAYIPLTLELVENLAKQLKIVLDKPTTT